MATFKITFKNGDTYVGEAVKGLPHGKGVYTFKNGDVYEGAHANGYPCGKGVITYKNGDVYTGPVKKGRPNGDGTYTFNDGDVYIGRMKKGMFHGQGKYYSGGVTLIYEGAWKNDEKHGFGTEYYDDGGKYVGNLKKGERHGKGKIYYPDGGNFKTYEGRFVHDIAKGKGLRTYSNGMTIKASYSGEDINKSRDADLSLHLGFNFERIILLRKAHRLRLRYHTRCPYRSLKRPPRLAR